MTTAAGQAYTDCFHLHQGGDVFSPIEVITFARHQDISIPLNGRNRVDRRALDNGTVD